MAPRWSKKEIEELLKGYNDGSSFVSLSYSTFSCKRTPSECKAKIDELSRNPWSSKELDQVRRSGDLICCNPYQASLRFQRPICVLQRKYKLLALARRKPLLHLQHTPMEQRQVNKMCPGSDVEKMALSDVDNLLLSGLEKERKKLRELLGLRGCIAIVGPEQSGKKVLLRSVCEELNIQINVVPHKNHEPQDSYLVHHAFSQKSMNSLLFFDDETLCKWGAALVDFLSYPRSKKDIFVVLCLSRPYVLDKMVIRLFGQRLILVNPPAALIRTLILKKILQEKDIEVSDSIDLQMFGTLTYGYNPKELERLCDLASSARLTREVHDEPSSHSSLLKVSQGDLIEAFQRIEPLSSLPLLQSMKDWCESVASVKND